MPDKMILMGLRAQELPTTLRVIRAFPADKLDWKPHERSMSAGQLINTLIGEQRMVKALVEKGAIMPDDEAFFAQNNGTTLEELAATYGKVHGEIHAMLEATPDAWWDQMISFFGHQMPAKTAAWIGFLDHIHHRGQLSVFIRLAGGKVPSIYGPSADDPGNM